MIPELSKILLDGCVNVTGKKMKVLRVIERGYIFSAPGYYDLPSMPCIIAVPEDSEDTE